MICVYFPDPIQCTLVITLEAIHVLVYFDENLPSLDPTSADVFTPLDTHSKNSSFHTLNTDNVSNPFGDKSWMKSPSSLCASAPTLSSSTSTPPPRWICRNTAAELSLTGAVSTSSASVGFAMSSPLYSQICSSLSVERNRSGSLNSIQVNSLNEDNNSDSTRWRSSGALQSL